MREEVAADALKEIEEIVGEENLSTELAERFCYSRDFSFIDVVGEVLPDVVVWPTSTEQVSRLVKLADERRIPVVPRSAGTGECGGAMPIMGGIVLDLTHMKRVLEVDTKNMMCLVEPGIVCDELNDILAKDGFFLPPVPASSEMATIGGCVANNSAGYRTVKYGSFRNWVMGLEVVLPRGDVIWTGSKTRKTSSGYDLTRLFVGSEGTLGIFTKVRLRVHPVPECRWVFMAHYGTIDGACLTIMDTMSGTVLPSAAEVMDEKSIEAVIKYGIELPRSAAIAIIELDGSEKDVEERLNSVKEIALRHGAIGTRVGVDAEEQQELWTGRKSITPALAAIKPNVIDEDIAVPVSQLLELFRRIGQLSKELNIDIATYGHAGDGNLHPDVIFDKRDPEEVKRAIVAVKRLREITVELGGTITGEHGIGLRRAGSMRLEHSEQAINVMRLVKKSLDPNNTMNPGKVFPPNGDDRA